MEGQRETKSIHVAMFPSAGMGHLIPFCALAKRLSSHIASLRITFVVFDNAKSSERATSHLRLLQSISDTIRIVTIPGEQAQDAENANPAEISSAMMADSLPHIQRIIAQSHCTGDPITLLIVDMFCIPILPAYLRTLELPIHIFYTSSLAVLTLIYHLPRINAETVDLINKNPDKEIFRIDGLPGFRRADLMQPMHDRSKFHGFRNHYCHIRRASGILINTFQDLDRRGIPALVDYITKNDTLLPPVYAVGPLLSAGPCGEESQWILAWLDEQPERTVLVVSFGSSVAIAEDQLAEIAWALEHSGHRFLWIVRRKAAASASASSAYFGMVETEERDVLPQGFVDRTQGRGLVVPSWAPQMEILGHAAVGGMISHCGWNSVLECIWCGVPMVCWPMFADQMMNTAMVAKEYGFGLDLLSDVDVNGGCVFVGREKLLSALRELMDGEAGKRAREKGMELSQLARQALSANGSSLLELCRWQQDVTCALSRGMTAPHVAAS